MATNRDRTLSETSASSSSLSWSMVPPQQQQQQHNNNRGRADTGDSTLSSDTSGTTNSMGGPRRRSHRPRGCRGGRKNKRKKNKVPSEILGPTTSYSLSSNLLTTTSSLGVSGGPVPLPPPAKSTHVNTGGGVGDSRHGPTYLQLASTHLVERQTTSSQLASSSNKNAQHATKPLSDKQGATNPILPYSSNNSNSINNKPYKIETRPMKDHHRHGHRNNLQQVGGGNGNMLNISRGKGCTSTTTAAAATTASRSGSILPPLPTLPKPTRQICTGPNPYSLTKNSSTSVKVDSVSPTLPPSLPPPSSQVVRSVVSNENYGFHAMSKGVVDHSSNDNKQNNNRLLSNHNKKLCVTTPTMPINNNSLFAISPRSFLTGPPAKHF